VGPPAARGSRAELGYRRTSVAGLSETDDPEIAAAMKRLYGRFQRFARKQVGVDQERFPGSDADPGLVAWAIVGLGTVSNIGRELGLLSPRARKRLVVEMGRALLGRR
jgi:hypothetical protein